MKVWFVWFVLLLGIVELYQWVVGAAWWHQVTLPLPVWVGAGVVLAIASNYNKRLGVSWDDAPAMPPSPAAQPAAQPAAEALPSAAAPAQPPIAPRLPNFEFDLRPRKPISFTIRQPEARKEE